MTSASKRLILRLWLTLTTAKAKHRICFKPLQFRCGYQIQISEEDARIDAYIEKLIAGVDDEIISQNNVLEDKKDDLQITGGDEGEIMDHIEKNENDDEYSKKSKDIEVENKIKGIDGKEKGFRNGEAIEIEKTLSRPNALYRFLLDKGFLGQLLVMTIVFLSEFLYAFSPNITDMLTFLISKILGTGVNGGHHIYDFQREDDMVTGEILNEQYVAFGADSRSIRGKQKKIITKKADKVAAEQLRRVGNLQKARYCHVSEIFLRRHKLGPFQIVESNLLSNKGKVSCEGRNGEEEDTSWVVEAFTKDNNAADKPSVSVIFSNDGMDVEVGCSIGEKKLKSRDKIGKSRRASRSLIRAATTRSSSLCIQKKKVRSRVSNREGGSGVMKRLRIMSTNNLVSRSLLGAYPGDALPPQAAASSNGVVDLASKYGYGDWSTEDKGNFNKNRRRKKRHHTKSLSSSKRSEPKKISQITNDCDRRRKSSKISLPLQTTASDTRKSITTLKIRNNQRKIVPVPTRLLKEKMTKQNDVG